MDEIEHGEAAHQETARPAGRRTRRTLVVVAAAVVVAAGGGAIAMAAGSSTSSHTGATGAQAGEGGTPPTATPPTGTAPSTGPGSGGSGHGPGGFGGLGGFGAFAGVVHGTFVVRSGTGYVTEEVRSGTVTALSSTSVTVKGSDGTSGIFAVGSATKRASGVKNGTTVTVIATAGTATAIVEPGAASGGGHPGGFGRPSGTRPSGAPSWPGSEAGSPR